MIYEDVPGWALYFDESTNAYYYYNLKSGETQWEIPSVTKSETSINYVNRPSLVAPGGFRPGVEHSKKKIQVVDLLPMLPQMETVVGDDEYSDIDDVDIENNNEYAFEREFVDLQAVGSTKELPKTENSSTLPLANLFDSNALQHDYSLKQQNMPVKLFDNLTSSEHFAEGGTSQDYIGLARLYRLQRPYSDLVVGANCILCRKGKITESKKKY